MESALLFNLIHVRRTHFNQLINIGAFTHLAISQHLL